MESSTQKEQLLSNKLNKPILTEINQMPVPINHCLKSFFCCPRRETRAEAPPPPAVTIDRVSGWINQVDREIPLVNSLNSNGLYSLLNREITVMNNLLAESNTLLAGVNPLTSEAVRTAINQLVSPKKVQLEQALAVAQQKIREHRAEVQSDEAIAKKWTDLNFPAEVLQRHADCARFLIESKLAFSIAGFRETSQNPELHDLKLADDGHPLIKVRGEWMRWEQLKAQVLFDPESNQIRSRDYPGQIVESWTYLSPQGLVRMDRVNHDHLVDIYQLSPEEYQRTLAFARRFYETNPEVDVGIPKDCVLQYMTTSRKTIFAVADAGDEDHYLNVISNAPIHVVVRLIMPDGKLYSCGIEVTAEGQEFMNNNFFATVPAKVNKGGDYEEFREFDKRIVTCIPLTNARAEGIINELNEMGTIQFQYGRQNCSVLMRLVMRGAGYEPVNNQRSIASILIDSLPNLEHLPKIGPLIAKVQTVTTPIFKCIHNLIPKCVKVVFSTLKAVVLFIPGKIGNFVLNLLQLKLGAGKMLYPLPAGTAEDEFYDQRRLINFSSSIRSFWDMFKDETSTIYHSKPIIDWQKKQKSTFIEPYSGSPKLVVVPPAAAAS